MSRAQAVDATQVPPLEIAHVLFLEIVAYSPERWTLRQNASEVLQS